MAAAAGGVRLRTPTVRFGALVDHEHEARARHGPGGGRSDEANRRPVDTSGDADVARHFDALQGADVGVGNSGEPAAEGVHAVGAGPRRVGVAGSEGIRDCNQVGVLLVEGVAAVLGVPAAGGGEERQGRLAAVGEDLAGGVGDRLQPRPVPRGEFACVAAVDLAHGGGVEVERSVPRVAAAVLAGDVQGVAARRDGLGAQCLGGPVGRDLGHAAEVQLEVQVCQHDAVPGVSRQLREGDLPVRVRVAGGGGFHGGAVGGSDLQDVSVADLSGTERRSAAGRHVPAVAGTGDGEQFGRRGAVHGGAVEHQLEGSAGPESAATGRCQVDPQVVQRPTAGEHGAGIIEAQDVPGGLARSDSRRQGLVAEARTVTPAGAVERDVIAGSEGRGAEAGALGDRGPARRNTRDGQEHHRHRSHRDAAAEPEFQQPAPEVPKGGMVSSEGTDSRSSTAQSRRDAGRARARESSHGKGPAGTRPAPARMSHEELFPKSSPPLATDIIAHIHHFRNRRHKPGPACPAPSEAPIRRRKSIETLGRAGCRAASMPTVSCCRRTVAGGRFGDERPQAAMSRREVGFARASCTCHRCHRPGRLVSRRVPSGQGLRGARHDEAHVAGQHREAARHPGRSCLDGAVPAAHLGHDRRGVARATSRGDAARRDLQPGGAEPCGGVLRGARANDADHGAGSAAPARGSAVAGFDRSLLPGLLLGDVRVGPGPPE